jgi:epoxyqueuosine reductase QueG
MFERDDIVRIGNDLGFEIVKFCSAEPFTDYSENIKNRINKGYYPKELTMFEKILEEAEEISDPSNSLKGSKTIISMAFRFYTDSGNIVAKRHIRIRFTLRCLGDCRCSARHCVRKA